MKSEKTIKLTEVPALEKGLDILEFLSKSATPYSLSQIAKELHRSVSEIQRPIQYLIQRGYLFRDSTGSFQLSSKFFFLAHHYPSHQRLLSVALPWMQSFSQQTELSVHFSVRQGINLVIIGQIESQTRARITIQNALSLDLFTTASGKILFAYLPEATQKLLLSRAKLSPKELSLFHSQIKTILKTGFIYTDSHYYKGLNDLAVPLLDYETQELHGVLATSWIDPREKTISQDWIIEKLKETAQQITTSWNPTLFS